MSGGRVLSPLDIIARYIAVVNAAATTRTARLAAGLTQAELAVRSGVRQPNIAAYAG